MSGKHQWLAAIGSMTLALVGCQGPPHDAQLDAALPADFALQMRVIGEAGGDNPLRQSAQYLVEPNRNLRIALGPGATSDYYPALSRRLTPAQFESIARFVNQRHLTAEPTSPLAEKSAASPAAALPGSTSPLPPLLYEVSITSNGRTHDYRTTPQESPPTARLLEMLWRLGRGEAR